MKDDMILCVYICTYVHDILFSSFRLCVEPQLDV